MEHERTNGTGHESRGRNQGHDGNQERRATRPKTVYALTERGEKTHWTKIGAAFENRDGSLTIRLDAFAVSGVMNVREERDE